MIRWVFPCGCNLAEEELLRYSGKILCPKHNTRATARESTCGRCGKTFQYTLRGKAHLLCKKCRKIKAREHKKNKRAYYKDIEDPVVPRRNWDCEYYEECLSTRLFKDSAACVGCAEYSPKDV